MEYLIRFAQAHETFRRPEIEALASLAGIDLEIIFYDEFVGVYSSPLYFFSFFLKTKIVSSSLYMLSPLH